MLGGTGMGYFSCAYGLFLPVFALSVTGINTAVSALTAQALAKNDPQTADRTASLAMRMFGLGGILFSLLLFLTAEPFCTLLLHNPRAALSVRCFAPAVWFCCVNAVLRGICEGHSTMQPTAVSQVTEGIGRAVCGLGLCGFVCRHPESRLALRLAIGLMDTIDDLYHDGQAPAVPDYIGRADL
jgi:stage V sporulation protein B